MEKRHKKAFLLDYYLSTYLGIEMPEVEGEEYMSKEQMMDRLCTHVMQAFPQEDVITNGRMAVRFEEYQINRIREAYGLTFDEFIDLPFSIVEDRLNHQRLLLAKERHQARIAKQRAEKEPQGRDNDFPFIPT